jgi:hypothetical protein
VHKGSQMIKWGDGMDSQVGRERNQRTSVPKLSIIDACVCVCAFRCVSQCVHRCSVRCPPSKGPKEVQLENQQYRFLFIYKTQISRNLAYPQPRLYYRLAISPRCFYPHPLLVRDTPLFIRDTLTIDGTSTSAPQRLGDWQRTGLAQAVPLTCELPCRIVLAQPKSRSP